MTDEICLLDSKALYAACCNEVVDAVEDPEQDGPDSGKEYYIDSGRLYDARGGRVVLCPYCGAEIQSTKGREQGEDDSHILEDR